MSLKLWQAKLGLIAAGGLLVVATMTRAEQENASTASAASTQPAQSSEDVLTRMLRPSGARAAEPLQPSTAPGTMIDQTSGARALAPDAPPTHVLREGDMIVNRTGRLTRSADGQQWEFTFDADGKTLQDPPLIILPNLKLMDMEEAVKSSRRDLRFRITGEVTEYRGRNYVLLQKVLVVPEVTQQF